VEGARVELDGKQAVNVGGCSDVTSLSEARVAYYGQKAKNALSLAINPSYQDFLVRVIEQDAPFRIFHSGGNPMIVRLADRVKIKDRGVIAGIDAVFEVCGQQLHDVLPGVYIAKKVGAYFCDLDGVEYADEYLGELLQNPKTRITYVLAATKELALELASMLKPKRIIAHALADVQGRKQIARAKPEQLQFASFATGTKRQK
jgi:hypothetical protein